MGTVLRFDHRPKTVAVREVRWGEGAPWEWMIALIDVGGRIEYRDSFLTRDLALSAARELVARKGWKLHRECLQPWEGTDG